MHARELLGDDPRTHVLALDFLDPERVLAEAVARGGLDLRRPVAVLAVYVLHFVPDERRPAEILARYLDAAGSGSHLAISHTTGAHRPAVLRPAAFAGPAAPAHHR